MKQKKIKLISGNLIPIPNLAGIGKLGETAGKSGGFMSKLKGIMGNSAGGGAGGLSQVAGMVGGMTGMMGGGQGNESENDPTQQLIQQGVSTGANMLLPGSGVVLDTMAAVGKKFGKNKCTPDPNFPDDRSKDICVDDSSVAANFMKNTLNPVQNLYGIGKDALSGNWSGVANKLTFGLAGSKDTSKFDEAERQMKVKQQTMANMAAQQGQSQQRMASQGQYTSPAFGMNSYKKGGRLVKLQNGKTIPEFVKNPKNNTEKVMAEKWIKQNPSANIPQQKKELTGVSKWVSENIYPFGYGEDSNSINNESGFLDKAQSIYTKLTEDNSNIDKTTEADKRRMDAWKMYLGGSPEYQDNNSIVKSKYRPAKGDTKNDEYYTFKDDIRNKLFESYRNAHRDTKGLSVDDEMALLVSKEAQSPQDRKRIEELKNNIPILPFGKKVLQDTEANVMGHYTSNVGKDDKGHYVSFYDKWDLSPNVFEKDMDKSKQTGVGTGTPQQFYDRIYYDPKTKEMIAEKPTILPAYTFKSPKLVKNER